MLHGHRDLRVFQTSYQLAMEIFHLSKGFPREELYSLTDQVRRSSRSVAANVGEGFRKRRYPKMFVSKLTDCDAEATETQVWIDFCLGLRLHLAAKSKRFDRRIRGGGENALGD